MCDTSECVHTGYRIQSEMAIMAHIHVSGIIHACPDANEILMYKTMEYDHLILLGMVLIFNLLKILANEVAMGGVSAVSTETMTVLCQGCKRSTSCTNSTRYSFLRDCK